LFDYNELNIHSFEVIHFSTLVAENYYSFFTKRHLRVRKCAYCCTFYTKISTDNIEYFTKRCHTRCRQSHRERFTHSSYSEKPFNPFI